MPNKSVLFISLFSISVVLAVVGFTITPHLQGSVFHHTPQGQRHVGSADSISFYHEYDKPVVLSHTQNRVIVRVGAVAPSSPASLKRLPLNLSIVLDKSGSMHSQNKIENAKQGAIDMISHLNENDIVSLIVFDSYPRILMSAQHLSDKQSFIQAIRGIRADGSTALYDAVSLGARELEKNVSPGYLNRIVLLSDGMANVGPSSNTDFFRLGDRIIAQGINVSTIGLGLSFNEVLLSGLSENSGGNYYYTNSSDELPGIFNQEINKSITMMAQDIKIRLYTQNGTRAAGVIGPANKEQAYMVETWIPFLYGGEDKYRLIEIDVPALSECEGKEVARLDIQYFDPFAQQTKFYSQSLMLDSSRDSSLVRRMTNTDVIKDAFIRREAERKEEALQYARKGNYKRASKILVNASIELEHAADLYNDEDLRKASRRNKDLSRDVWNNKGYRAELMHSDVLNVHQEFWGN